MTAPYVGRSVPRVEDRRLLLGRGRYVADIRIPGMVEAAVLRSPFAHARILGIDAAAARALEGVVAVITAADLQGRVEPFTRMAITTPPALERMIDLSIAPYRAPVLASDEVFRVGEPVALVVASDRYVAEDALELIQVEYEPLPALTDPERALEPDAPQLHPEVPGNVAARFVVEAGDVDAAFARAPRTLHERFRIGRSIGVPIETRGAVAWFDRAREDLTLWSTTQRSHWLRTYLSEMLHLPEERVRVVAPDMGGSFGSGLYGEDIALSFASMLLGRPARWIEDRPENLANARHARDQIHDVDVAFDDEGTILGLKDRFVQDCGAWNPYSVIISYNTASNLRAEYRIDHVRVEATCVLTNKRENTPVRGAGRPEATFVIDRLVDMIADELGRDPIEVRMRNLIPAEAMPFDLGMPYRDAQPMVYDSGDFPRQVRTALELVDVDEWRRRQADARTQGRRVGIGMSTYVEGSGIGPYEGALVRVDATGHVVVHAGSNSHGQSHETTLAQICADALGVSLERVIVRTGDSSLVPFGGGTNASRSAVTAGNAVWQAAGRVREKVAVVAARLLEVDPSDVVIDAGSVHPRGAPQRSITLAEVAAAAAPGSSAHAELGSGLEAQAYFVPPTVTFSSGTHIAVVEVDEDTGRVDVLRYAVVDDAGRRLNPTVVEGQQLGGVAHGLGNALYEEAIYDRDGQFLTSTFMDYLLPTATEMPPVVLAADDHPSPLNPLGVKGCGEGGTVSPGAAVANAIADAFRPLRLRITELPLTPERLVSLIRSARVDAGSTRAETAG